MGDWSDIRHHGEVMDELRTLKRDNEKLHLQQNILLKNQEKLLQAFMQVAEELHTVRSYLEPQQLEKTSVLPSPKNL